MFGIAHRVFTDRLRVRYAIPIDHATPLDGVADNGFSFEEDDLKRALALGVEVLPIVEREVVVLFYFEALSLTEIANALDVPAGTVKSRLFRARSLLRQHFAS
jgi:RNA polymerase sigma-70 factor (ECF subfamily)